MISKLIDLGYLIIDTYLIYHCHATTRETRSSRKFSSRFYILNVDEEDIYFITAINIYRETDKSSFVMTEIIYQHASLLSLV